MKQNPQTVGALLRDFIVFGALGCLAGAGVGFFVFVRLGFPKDSEYMVGYLSALFIGAGVKFGISIWVLRVTFSFLRRLWVDSSSCASSYHFKDMDLEPRDASIYHRGNANIDSLQQTRRRMVTESCLDRPANQALE